MILLDGRFVAGEIKKEIIEKTLLLKDQGITPGLAVIIAGSDQASQSYVKNKEKLAASLGFNSRLIELPLDVTQEELFNQIDLLNKDPMIHGILVQLPLPGHIDGKKVLEKISRHKDVDGFNPYNVGKLGVGDSVFKPCTPYGIMKLIDYYNIDLSGKHVVILGRSNIVGKPVAHLMLERDATITMCHSKSKNISNFTRQADVIVAAIGKAKYLKRDMVKKGAIIIDVGINRLDGKMVGDVDFENLQDIADMITPVPGGVGAMTVIMLMYNTLESAMRFGGIL